MGRGAATEGVAGRRAGSHLRIGADSATMVRRRESKGFIKAAVGDTAHVPCSSTAAPSSSFTVHPLPPFHRSSVSIFPSVFSRFALTTAVPLHPSLRLSFDEDRGYALKRGCPKSGHLRPTSTRSLEDTALSLILLGSF